MKNPYRWKRHDEQNAEHFDNFEVIIVKQPQYNIFIKYYENH